MKFYEIYSLIVGFGAILTILFFLIYDREHCIILLEPKLYIRIPEIIMGISTIPYYFKKLFVKYKK